MRAVRRTKERARRRQPRGAGSGASSQVQVSAVGPDARRGRGVALRAAVSRSASSAESPDGQEGVHPLSTTATPRMPSADSSAARLHSCSAPRESRDHGAPRYDSIEVIMATRLDKVLKRELDIDGKLYMLALSPEG